MTEGRAGAPSVMFLRTAAGAWMVSAGTTLALIVLPRFYGAVADPVLGLERLYDPAYRTRVIVAFLHPVIVLVGVAGLVLVRLPSAAGASLVTLLGFLLWAGTEGVQQALVLVAVNWTWRPAYLAASSAAGRDVVRAQLLTFSAVSDALFFFLLVAFMIGNVAAATAMWRTDRLGRLVALGFVLATALTVISMLTTFGGGVLPAGVMAVLYPTIQPVARLLTGVWLWRAATRLR